MPTKEEIGQFRANLEQDGKEIVLEKLRNMVYGTKTRWKYKEAEAYLAKHEEVKKNKTKQELLRHTKKGILLHEESNKIAQKALYISISALIISVLVAIFK